MLLLGLFLVLAATPAVLAQRVEPARPARAHPRRMVRLDSAVPETSALLYTSGALWTLNDGDNPPELFRIDSASGRVVQRVRIVNFPNTDWEELTADSRYFYIGDFGNNAGSRRDLRVLRLPRPGPTDTVAVAEEIAFTYPEQTEFAPGTYRHNFDCEAFFVAHDSLHLFAKRWADGHTRHYTLPTQPGRYIARPHGLLDVQGLVTAAALAPDGRTAALLGYTKNGRVFLWLLTDFADTNYLSARARRLRLPTALRLGQVEGLCFTGPARVFISNERLARHLALVRQRLYVLNLRRWLTR
ncbi:hypothetical protein GCM10022407_09900 [Hymenobacter antarcticus]|uniref:T9SS C-terminal target domain-containing protein n=1 Tax=Hymenobacter antarcticus TaxID=486270 RepID=A0ABP7PJD9_9BACT